MNQPKIVTRFPPSPTGPFHVGSARTALFNYLFAKRHGGRYILRFEDTDRKRSSKEFEDDIFHGLGWLGIQFDEVHRQSDRGLIYRRYIEKMLADGTAYVSLEKPKAMEAHGENDENGTEEYFDEGAEIIRFKNPGRVVSFKDEVRGEISVNTEELGDFVIAKGREAPLYHLAVVIDDLEMGVTHVIRGEDGIYNTPRQILLQEAFSAPRPIYAHIPFVLGTDREKLSKRHGAVSITSYREEGYLPEAVINYLALLGWNPGTDQEIFSMEELIRVFDIDRIQKSPAVFNLDKLNWVNRQYIEKMPDEKFRELAEGQLPEVRSLPQFTPERFGRLLPEIRERTTLVKDIRTAFEAGDFGYFFALPTISAADLVPKKSNSEETRRHLLKLTELLGLVSEDVFNKEKIKEAVWEYASKEGRGEVLWPMRYALSGKLKSPDPISIAHVLGKTETLSRLKFAQDALAKAS